MNIENIDFVSQTPVEIIEKTTKKVEDILNKFFPDHIAFEKGKYTISRGSTQVMVIIRPFTKDNSSVEFIATVVSDGTITPDLAKFLLRTNSELHIGSFGLLFDDTIVYQHSLSGNTLVESNFIETLNVVATISDFYDDEIMLVAGGKRAIDQ